MVSKELQRDAEPSTPHETLGSFLGRIFLLSATATVCSVPFFLLKNLPITMMYALWSLLCLLFALGFYTRNVRRSSLVAFNLFIVSGLLLSVELGMTIMHDEWVRDSWSEPLTEIDAELGKISRASVTTRHLSYPLTMDYEMEWDVTYHTEADRTRRVPNQPVKGKRLAIFGGSFVFGAGLEDEDTITNHLQKLLPEYRIYNYGIREHGTAQNYFYLKRVLTQWPDTQL